MAKTGEDLGGQVALVTGAASGLGLATAKLFAAEGAQLVLVDLQAERLSSLGADLAGLPVETVAGDVAEASTARMAVEAALARYGRLDILFNNAGIDMFGVTSVLGTSEAEWDRMMAVNVKSAYLFAREAVPAMIRNPGGAIVNIGSVAGIQISPSQTAYSVSKAAIIALTKCLAVDFGHQGIRTNCVCPGNLELPMAGRRSHLSVEDLERRAGNAAAVTPLGRPGKYEEMANVVLFLSTSRSSYMNGSVVVVDGGWTAAVPRVSPAR